MIIPERAIDTNFFFIHPWGIRSGIQLQGTKGAFAG
jgi:hypothetical protein